MFLAPFDKGLLVREDTGTDWNYNSYWDPRSTVTRVCVCVFRNEPAFDVSYKICCQQIIRLGMIVNQEVPRMDQFLTTRLQTTS